MFFRLERQQAKNNIFKLMINGNVSDDSKNIATFSPKNIVICLDFSNNTWMISLNLYSINKLSEYRSTLLKEIEEAFHSLKANKSPGTDELSSEFSKNTCIACISFSDTKLSLYVKLKLKKITLLFFCQDHSYLCHFDKYLKWNRYRYSILNSFASDPSGESTNKFIILQL